MLSPTERSENIGRMKQLNEQIRTNNEKIIEIKQKINGHWSYLIVAILQYQYKYYADD